MGRHTITLTITMSEMTSSQPKRDRFAIFAEPDTPARNAASVCDAFPEDSLVKGESA